MIPIRDCYRRQNRVSSACTLFLQPFHKIIGLASTDKPKRLDVCRRTMDLGCMPNGVIDTKWDRIRRIPFEKRTRQESLVLKRLSSQKVGCVREEPYGVNEDEEIARIWLEMNGYVDIQRADDPPDYVVEGRYGVEVRRLNRMVEVDGRNEGEEVSLIPLSEIVEDVLEELGPPHPGEHSWYVDINYEIDVGQPPKRDSRLGEHHRLRKFYITYMLSSMRRPIVRNMLRICEGSFRAFRSQLIARCSPNLPIWVRD